MMVCYNFQAPLPGHFFVFPFLILARAQALILTVVIGLYYIVLWLYTQLFLQPQLLHLDNTT